MNEQNWILNNAFLATEIDKEIDSAPNYWNLSNNKLWSDFESFSNL